MSCVDDEPWTEYQQGEESVTISEAQSFKYNVSVMREFLEPGVEFEWPEKLGVSSGNHCDIVGSIPLKWKKKISDKMNASIDMFEAGPGFNFQKPFVVKTIRDPDTQKAMKMTADEVENMRDLRHPHITALLATFRYQARLHILIFPAACCDLHQFLERMSEGFDEDPVVYRSDGTNTVNNDTTSSRQPRDSNVGSVGNNKGNDSQEVRSEPWPFKNTIDKQVEMLRGYFVCLSQALSYLHGSGVRHKDIKPENILIDESGSVILTDFGISRRFPKHVPHATNNERKFTRKYASPEIMDDRNVIRDDSSDVFSLGCVFLEMATLLLGKNLCNLSDHCATIINDTSKEEAYHCNLGKVHSWIDHLRFSRGFKPVQENTIPGETNNDRNFRSSPDNNITAALVDIRQMLDETPSKRPVSTGLWQRFQHISAILCRDCDPRHPEVWKPSARQQRDAQTGLNRRSLHAMEERITRNIEASVSNDIGIQLNGDAREARPIRSSSPVPKTEMVSEEINPEIAPELAIYSPAIVIDKPFTHVGRPISNDVRSTRSPPSSKPQVTNPDLAPQRAIQQDQQAQAHIRGHATGEDKSTSEIQRYNQPPQMRIIVYDVLQTKAYEDVLASLEGAYILPPA